MLAGEVILSLTKLIPLIEFILSPLTTSLRNELLIDKGHQFSGHAF